MSSDPKPSTGAAAAVGESAPGSHPHDFDAQKEIHQRIRNDPDYDDWEYGTEPLPHEAWVPKAPQDQGSAESGGSSTR
ncbi:MAG: hypothetical protein ACKO6F_09320 [Cyanobium sp.]